MRRKRVRGERRAGDRGRQRQVRMRGEADNSSGGGRRGVRRGAAAGKREGEWSGKVAGRLQVVAPFSVPDYLEFN